MKRRQFIQASVAASGAVMMGNVAHAAPSLPLGKAEHCVMLWLGGGMSQIDTFDPKKRGDAKQKKAGSYYAAIDTAVPGVQVCEHLSKTARMMENVTAIRTLNHDVVDEHAAAANRMHTGRSTGGTVTYPSLGSIVADQRGRSQKVCRLTCCLGTLILLAVQGFWGPRLAMFIPRISTRVLPGSQDPNRLLGIASHDAKACLIPFAMPGLTVLLVIQSLQSCRGWWFYLMLALE